MEYERSTSILTKPIESKNVTLIWANDGWCYIPQLKLRQRFTETHYTHQEWAGVIAMPEYIEQVTWSLHSKDPRIWQENDELYSLKSSNQKVHKNKKHQRAPRQQAQRP
jgi:hypothetical protein